MRGENTVKPKHNKIKGKSPEATRKASGNNTAKPRFFFKVTLPAWLIKKYLSLVWKTSRKTYTPSNALEVLSNDLPAIIAVWHGQFLLVAFLKPENVKAKVIVARHGDAQIIGRVMELFDTGNISGAGAGGRRKDKGGTAALKGALNALKNNTSIVSTADVPPGPARKVGMGIITMARMSGKPIVPVAVATSHYKSLSSWSRFTVNLPFSKMTIAVGEPLYVPRRASKEELETSRLQLEETLHAITTHAYDLAGVSSRAATPLAYRKEQGMGFQLKLYQFLIRLAKPLAPAILRYRQNKGKESPDRIAQRYGEASIARPEGPLIWFHAASVGETNAILPLVRELKKNWPHYSVLLTTMTLTSAHIAKQHLPKGAFHQTVPLDHPDYLNKFLDHWKPQLFLLVESELWPNMIFENHKRGIEQIIINGRMSKRSFRKWRKYPEASLNIFSRFSLVLTQNHEQSLWFHRLGAKEVRTIGNLKLDSPAPPVDKNKLNVLTSQLGERPVWLAASTHGEEELIIGETHKSIAAQYSNLLTIIAPRHPHRGASIEAALKENGLNTARRSLNELITAETEIYIADTIGELGLFYSLVEIAFIGGSFIPHGGQNPVEAIKLNTVVLSGPQTRNFQDIYPPLYQADAAYEVENAEALSVRICELLQDPVQRKETNANAVQIIEEMKGGLRNTLQALTPYLTSHNSPGN